MHIAFFIKLHSTCLPSFETGFPSIKGPERQKTAKRQNIPLIFTENLQLEQKTKFGYIFSNGCWENEGIVEP